MEITSFGFVLISILSVIIYYLISHRYRVAFLVFLSSLFIASYSINLLVYVLIYSLLNFWIGKKIPDPRLKKPLFITGIIINLSQLVLLKYTSFTINPILNLLSIDYDLSIVSKFIIPVGISFFTLQGIGYLINVKMGWEKPEEELLPFLLYISFFPRFLSGPIDRSNHFLPQLKVEQSFSSENVIKGFRLVLIGLFKKAVIANNLGAVVNGVYSSMDASDNYSLWIVLLIQPLYLYYDFSGYTDIAIGFARAFGIELRPNFNKPFMSENMTMFWKSFHISLSSWFHDYVFMRTMFKTRKWGKRSTTFALFLTWVLFGIWHGAGWNFMLLGFIQALAIYYEFSSKRWRLRVFSKMPSFPRMWMGRIITYLFYASSLVFFFSPDVSTSIRFFSGLPQLGGALPGSVNVIIFVIALIFAISWQILEVISVDLGSLHKRLEAYIFGSKNINRVVRWAMYVSILALILLLSNEAQQFVYFQF